VTPELVSPCSDSGASGSASINRQFKPVWLTLDDAHVLGVESTDPNDLVQVTDIAVVENQIARGAVARPMPELPPVTNATWPEKS
jgi:hypothetical protein